MTAAVPVVDWNLTAPGADPDSTADDVHLVRALQPGENRIAIRGLVADDAAVAFDIAEIFDTDQQPKHHRLGLDQTFVFKLHAPPAF